MVTVVTLRSVRSVAPAAPTEVLVITCLTQASLYTAIQTASVDLTPLGSGRPRDVTSCPPNAAAITDSAMNAIVATETECMVIGTSQGQVLVLSANRLEQLGVQEQGAAKGEDGAASALLSSHQLRAEPRLTAIVAWNPALAAAHAGTTTGYACYHS